MAIAGSVRENNASATRTANFLKVCSVTDRIITGFLESAVRSRSTNTTEM